MEKNKRKRQKESQIAISDNFHFSHCKSMEDLKCHGNESTWATAVKTQFM